MNNHADQSLADNHLASHATAVVSSDVEELILVNALDEIVGKQSKKDCHLHDGILHRAFSVFIFNPAGDVLLQRRSRQKLLWPNYWSNACCSHPRAGEDTAAAACRRLEQELGVATTLTFLYKFIYQARYQNIGSEHELCWVWVGLSDTDPIIANSNEVAEWHFLPVRELETQLIKTPDAFTPWLKLEWPRIREYHRHRFPV